MLVAALNKRASIAPQAGLGNALWAYRGGVNSWQINWQT